MPKVLRYVWIAFPIVVLLAVMSMPTLRVLMLMEGHGGIAALSEGVFEMPAEWSQLHGKTLKRKIQGEFRKYGVHLGVDKVSLAEDFELDADATGLTFEGCTRNAAHSRALVFIPFSLHLPVYGKVTHLACFSGVFSAKARRANG